MKRQRSSDAGVLSAGVCLGQTCGTNIDTEEVEFTRERPNLTYLDKVFSFLKDTSSPILFNLNTGGMLSDLFLSEFILDGCSIIPCTLSPNAVFNIENSFVAVDFFGPANPASITPGQVTLDGFPVDTITFENGQFTARAPNAIARIQNRRCLDLNLPTKAFFLINNAGPWVLRATYVLEGTVNTGGRTCRFCARFSNAPDAPNTMLPAGSLSNFAVRDLALPCSINGISPDILFQFNAKVNLINPELTTDCGIITTNGTGSSRVIINNVLANNCRLVLTSTVSVEPVVHVQTVRRTLFCVNACEGLQPCQGSVFAAAIEDSRDCDIGGVDRPDCRCRSGCRSDACDRSVRSEVFGGNQNLGGVIVGAGTCKDCNDVAGISDRDHDCHRHDRDDNDVAGISRCVARLEGFDVCGSDRLAGISRRKRHNGVLGITDKVRRTVDKELLEELLKELVEELSDDLCCDTAGVGFGTDGTLGIGDKGIIGARRDFRDNEKEDFKDSVRSIFRLHGANGCSW